MIKSKYLSVMVAAAMCLALLGCIAMVVFAGSATTATTEYEKKLFHGETVTIDIQVDEEDWQGLLDNAQNKEYISADLVINGDLFSSVGIRTKGNSSLTQAGGSDNNRYSLQLNPDKYVKGQSFYGLDTMCINNMMGDATYMKDAIAYDIMDYLEVPSPLTNYASVTINGEAYGLFLLLERYDDSFLDREYNTTAGELYNVKISMGNRSDFEADDMETVRPDLQNEVTEEESTIGSSGRQTIGDGKRGGGMSGFSSGGGSLVYTDDAPESYYSIFDNAVSEEVSDSDKTQMITAIQKLNEGEELEKYWDVDEILRYLAAHTFVVNLDSYISNMQQNYYLYEKNGVVSVLPWDYNLAFGGYQSNDAGNAVNFPIDTPVSDVEMEERPLVSQLFAVEEYLEKYHEYLNEIVEGYVNGGLFSESVARIDSQISEYVKTDATAYYTYDEYEAAVDALEVFVGLRSESVAGQLEGSIPSTTETQSENEELLIDTGDLNLSAMGSMGNGKMGGGLEDAAAAGQVGADTAVSEQGGAESAAAGEADIGDMGSMLDMSLMKEIMAVLEDGELTEEGRAKLIERGISEDDIEQFLQMAQGTDSNLDNDGSLMDIDKTGGFISQEGMGGSTATSTAAVPLTKADWIMYGIIFAVFLAAILFMAYSQRRRWHKKGK